MSDRSRKPKRPRDVGQIAHAVVKAATDGKAEFDDRKSPTAVALGRLGGKKSGKAKAKSLSPERREEIARQAAAANWSKDAKGE